MPAPTPAQMRHTILAGVGWMLVSVAIYGTMNAASKALLVEMPVLELVFFRSLFALVPLIPGIRAAGRAAFISKNPPLQGVRAISGFTALVCFFYAIGHLPLADAVTLGFADAFWINGLSGPLLGEWAGRREWGLVGLGFLGVLIILRPGQGLIAPAALAAIGGSLCYAVSMIAVRKLASIDTRTVTVLSFTLLSLIASGAALPWIWVTPPPTQWPVLIMVGLLGGLAQIALIRAFSLAPPAPRRPLGLSRPAPWGRSWVFLLGGGSGSAPADRRGARRHKRPYPRPTCPATGRCRADRRRAEYITTGLDRKDRFERGWRPVIWQDDR